MTLECHQHVIRYMMGQLLGYFDDKKAAHLAGMGRKVKRHGFAVSKLVPSSLFYLPCQAQDAKDSFFTEFPGEALEPWMWEAAAVAMTQDPDTERLRLELGNDNIQQGKSDSVALKSLRDKLASKDPANDSATAIANAKAVYASTPAGMGLRHTGFFGLGLALKRLGLSDNEILGHLIDADYDRSRRNKKGIEGVLKSLKSSKWAS